MLFSEKLIDWYSINLRDLPWRATQDPYKIWLSEIVLQQTRVVQGMPYYLQFLERFPTVFDLAEAKEDEVLKLWQGLGYYSRARNLHATAQYIAQEKNGIFPQTAKELKKLKGVGEYTAHAIASFCFREPVAVLDGNVFRVLSRVFGVNDEIDTPAGKRIFKDLAQKLLDSEKPDLYNQAIMEFGALQCTPKAPLCNVCPFMQKCVAYQNQMIGDLPRKKKKVKVKEEHINYLVLVDNNGNTFMKQRTQKGIWRNLFEFPRLESEFANGVSEGLNETIRLKSLENQNVELTAFYPKPVKHLLSHRKLFIQFYIGMVTDYSAFASLSKKYHIVQNIHTFAVPVVIERFIGASDFFNS
ncbi:A/G-specific adenine glycosylase [uncultured Mesonia sp.]|uniref:A/G-specific adenine glycosylase n=1 Tax=uncultured Mesonia sp. TaxID=399731 RepID=UPI00374F23FD